MTEQHSEAVQTRTEGHIFEVTLDRPKANAIDLVTSRRMGEVFRAFRDDPEPVSYTHLRAHETV